MSDSRPRCLTEGGGLTLEYTVRAGKVLADNKGDEEMKIDERAQEWATETILSDLGGMEWDKIIEEMEEGNIPEDVSVWEPFEDYDAERLLEIWESFRDQFTRYAKEITKELKK